MTYDLLLILQTAPYGSSHLHEAIALALSASQITTRIAIILRGDALFCLQQPQQPEAIDRKSLIANIRALPLYDINDIAVIAEDCLARNIVLGIDNVQKITLQQFPAWIAKSKQVITV